MRKYYYPAMILVPLVGLTLAGCAQRRSSATFRPSHSLGRDFKKMREGMLRIDPPMLSKAFLSAGNVPAGQEGHVYLVVSFNDAAAPHQTLGTPAGAENATKYLAQKISLLKQFVNEIDGKGYNAELRKLMHHDVTCECDMGCYCQGGDEHPCHGCGVDLKACGRVGPGEREQMRTMAMGSQPQHQDNSMGKMPMQGTPDQQDNNGMPSMERKNGMQGMKGISARMPLNLCLVVDVSGSMKGAKIEQVREMVDVVADSIRDGDSLSLVTFANRPKMRLRGATVAQRERIKKAVRDVGTSGGTNIYAGLEMGYEVLKESARPQAINRLLLLSDGKDNKSRRDPQEFSVLSEQAVRHGMSVSSFGVGTDFDEDLLQTIADWRTGNTGRYHYIQDPKTIATAVRMDVFMPSQARKVRIGIFLDGARAGDVGLGLVRESDTTVFGNLKNISPMMRKAVVAKLRVPTREQGTINIGRIEVKYFNVQGEACVEEHALSAIASSSTQMLKQAEHLDVRQTAVVEEVRNVLSKCMLQLDNKKTPDALRTLGSAIRNMEDLLSRS